MAKNSSRRDMAAKEELDKESYVQLPLVKINFIIMGVAALMIVLGFIFISGGGTSDGQFNPEVFSARRVVVGPTIAFLGFIVMGAGIMWPGKKKDKQTLETDVK